MIYYRVNRLTGRLFRRVGIEPQEYFAKYKEWRVTSDAVDAFYDSSDYERVSEAEAIEVMELQNALVEKE